MVSPDSVWYARVLLLFSATSQTDTGSKTFDCALVSTLETYDDPENGNYCHYCQYWHYCQLCCFIVFIFIFVIMLIIVLIWFIWVLWIRLVLELYMSSTTRNRFYTSYQLKISLVNCRLYQLATPGQFHTACTTTFPGRLATAGRVPAMDAGCGLSTRGHWDGPVTCNEEGRAVGAVCCATCKKKGSMWSRQSTPCFRHTPPRSDGPTPIILVLPAVEGVEKVPA